jgi:hypothetical protein
MTREKSCREKVNFFLDTVCVELYTFVNCSISCCRLRCDIEKGRIENMATKKAAKKSAKKAAKKSSKKK